jgi:hypothetical protein
MYEFGSRAQRERQPSASSRHDPVDAARMARLRDRGNTAPSKITNQNPVDLCTTVRTGDVDNFPPVSLFRRLPWYLVLPPRLALGMVLLVFTARSIGVWLLPSVSDVFYLMWMRYPGFSGRPSPRCSTSRRPCWAGERAGMPLTRHCRSIDRILPRFPTTNR